MNYANGMFLAWNSPATNVFSAMTSTDGLRWTALELTNSGLVSYPNCFAGETNLAAFEYDGTNLVVQVSRDLRNWSQPVAFPSTLMLAATCAGGVYVAVGLSGGEAAVVSSPDGVNWFLRTFPGFDEFLAVAAGGGRFVAVGPGGAVVTSSDGLNWTSQVVAANTNGSARPHANDIYSVAYGKGMFVAGTANYPDSILTSTNGTNWAPHVSSPFWAAPYLYSIAYGNGMFVALTGNGAAALSTNGVDWRQLWPGVGGDIPLYFPTYGAGTFNILDSGGVVNINPSYYLAGSAGTNGTVYLTVTGGSVGQVGHIQAASIMTPSYYNEENTNWVDLLTFTNQDLTMHLEDTGATNHSQRFYRVRLP